MGKYSIGISYETGDSFNSEDSVDVLEITWDNLEVVKRNLKAIREHNKLYSNQNGYNSREHLSRDIIMICYSEEPWFVVDEINNCYGSLKLEADNGNYMQLHAFWCGYFETLHGAEILEDKSDMEFSV